MATEYRVGPQEIHDRARDPGVVMRRFVKSFSVAPVAIVYGTSGTGVCGGMRRAVASLGGVAITSSLDPPREFFSVLAERSKAIGVEISGHWLFEKRRPAPPPAEDVVLSTTILNVPLFLAVRYGVPRIARSLAEIVEALGRPCVVVHHVGTYDTGSWRIVRRFSYRRALMRALRQSTCEQDEKRREEIVSALLSPEYQGTRAWAISRLDVLTAWQQAQKEAPGPRFVEGWVELFRSRLAS